MSNSYILKHPELKNTVFKIICGTIAFLESYLTPPDPETTHVNFMDDDDGGDVDGVGDDDEDD